MKNNQARNNILGRLRSEKDFQFPTKTELTAQRQWPEWEIEDRVRHWRKQMEAVRTEVHETTHRNWPELLESLLQKKQIKSLTYAAGKEHGKLLQARWQEESPVTHLPYQPIGGEFTKQLFQVDAALTSTKAAIAETGTLVLWPDEEEPRLMSLVPPIHIALLERDNLYSNFSQIMEEQQWANSLPTNSLLISGPSKTADIEFQLAYGIHGPCELIVLLIHPDESSL